MSKRDVVTGCCVIAAVGSFVLAKGWINRQANLSSTYPLTIALYDAQGLERGAEVQIAGVRVGQVESVTLDSGLRRALVQVRLRREIQIPRDSYAFVQPPILKIQAGNAYGNLDPGEKLETLGDRLREKYNE